MLPDGMDFYNRAMRSGDLAGAISDCYQRLGRRATIHLLDDMMQMGFRESTRSGLSFGTDDLVTPDSKVNFIKDAEKEVMRLKKAYDRGQMADDERYNMVLDEWTKARELITDRHDGGDGVRHAKGPLVHQPRLLDEPLRCSWWYRPDPSAGRHAWFDGQADR